MANPEARYNRLAESKRKVQGWGPSLKEEQKAHLETSKWKDCKIEEKAEIVRQQPALIEEQQTRVDELKMKETRQASRIRELGMQQAREFKRT